MNDVTPTPADDPGTDCLPGDVYEHLARLSGMTPEDQQLEYDLTCIRVGSGELQALSDARPELSEVIEKASRDITFVRRIGQDRAQRWLASQVSPVEPQSRSRTLPPRCGLFAARRPARRSHARRVARRGRKAAPSGSREPSSPAGEPAGLAAPDGAARIIVVRTCQVGL